MPPCWALSNRSGSRAENISSASRPFRASTASNPDCSSANRTTSRKCDSSSTTKMRSPDADPPSGHASGQDDWSAHGRSRRVHAWAWAGSRVQSASLSMSQASADMRRAAEANRPGEPHPVGEGDPARGAESSPSVGGTQEAERYPPRCAPSPSPVNMRLSSILAIFPGTKAPVPGTRLFWVGFGVGEEISAAGVPVWVEDFGGGGIAVV